MVIVLEGTDTFRSRERLHQLREAFRRKHDPGGFNVVTLDGQGLRFEEFREHVVSQGFLSPRRFVVIERPTEAEPKVQEAMAELIRSKGVPETTILVVRLEDGAPRKRTASEPAAPWAVALAQAERRERFDPLEPTAVERWIVQRGRTLGATVERSAAALLASRVGNDLWRAANELEKLVHAHRGQPITAAAVTAAIAEQPEENIFALTDALGQRDLRQALTLLEQQLAEGAHPLYLLAMLARQVRILLGVAEVARSEPNPATVARRLQLHPFVARKALAQVRSFSQRELLDAHDALVAADQQLKSAPVDPRVVLERFVVRLCSPRP